MICARVIQGTLQVIERALHLRQQLPAPIGQGDAVAVTSQQPTTEVFLQRANLQADCAGSDPERLGGPGEIQLLRDYDEHAQAAKRQPANRPAMESGRTLAPSHPARRSTL